MIDLSPEYLSTVKSILQQLVPEYEVRVFGSRYKWLATTSSDLDLAIVGTDKLSEGLLSNLQDAFADSDLPFKVDVLDWNSLSDEFKAVVEQGYEVLQKPSKKLPEGWKLVRLGDLILPLITGKLNSNSAVEYGIYPFFTCDPNPLRINHYSFDCNAILLAGNNANGIFHLNRYNGKFNAYQRTYIIRNRDEVDIDFIYYQLKNIVSKFIGTAQGSATKFLTKPLIENAEIVLPISTLVQQSIAAILSSLDDLIKLNTEMNKKLEEIAQAIFKQWFIDFNFPDETGNPYKDSGGEMVDSEMGLIPKGSIITELSNIVTLNKGKSYKSSELANSGLSMVNLKCFGRNHEFRHDGIKYFVGQYKDSHIVKGNDLVISMTDVTQQAEIIANVLMIPNYLSKAIISLDVSSINSINTNISNYFLYYLLKTNLFREFAKCYASGTTVLHLNKNGVLHYKFVLPDRNILQQIESFLKDIIIQKDVNIAQNTLIENIRNTLLPTLMSGDILVPTIRKTEV